MNKLTFMLAKLNIFGQNLDIIGAQKNLLCEEGYSKIIPNFVNKTHFSLQAYW